MERTAWLRACLASNQSSLEHGNQLPDDHCHGRHACVCIASHIVEKLLDERHNMYTVKEQTDRKQKVERDIIIIRRRVVDQQLLDDLNNLACFFSSVVVGRCARVRVPSMDLVD